MHGTKDKQKSRQHQIDNKPEVLIENNDFHEYGDQPLNSSEIVQPKNFSQRHSSEFVFTTNKNEQNLGKYQEYDPNQSQKSNQLSGDLPEMRARETAQDSPKFILHILSWIPGKTRRANS